MMSAKDRAILVFIVLQGHAAYILNSFSVMRDFSIVGHGGISSSAAKGFASQEMTSQFGFLTQISFRTADEGFCLSLKLLKIINLTCRHIFGAKK